MDIGIIGTAGRKDDAGKLTRDSYNRMYGWVTQTIDQHHQGPYTARSGGAAITDHIAVSLYLSDHAEHLVLCLPAEFRDGKFVGNRDADTANYYHGRFSKFMGGNTLDGIARAIAKGAEVQVFDGFLNRNLETGKVDILIALTFGETSSVCWDTDQNTPSAVAGLKDGGTAHCWNHSNARLKIHQDLKELLR